jgi:restriction system protein
MAETKHSPSRDLAIRGLYKAFELLREAGGQLPNGEMKKRLAASLEMNDWERSKTASGSDRYWHVIHMTGIFAGKAGFLIRKNGNWYLTPEGEKVMLGGAENLYFTAKKLYNVWRQQNPKETASTGDEEEQIAENDHHSSADANIEEVRDRAKQGIRDFINRKNAYEFQALCAALLRAMGYYTPFEAPRGRDGGIDVIAYRDPLGTTAPRIKVQVKHRESSAGSPEINQLQGLLRNDGDVGIFFSSGGFSNDAKIAARNSRVHLELIDLDRFIDLWQDFYSKMGDDDKNLLPLTPIYFVAPSE